MNVLAFDFGASSGRAILGSLKDGKIEIKEIHRFDNEPVQSDGHWHWDLAALFGEIKTALCLAGDYDFESIGIDTWGVDHALISKDDEILGLPFHYRDERTNGIPEQVYKIIPYDELYKLSGIQVCNFNTIFQLLETKQSSPEIYEEMDKFVLMPDLFGYLLTGRVYAERSIASTTHMLDPYTKEWNLPLIQKAGLDVKKFPPLVDSGTTVGVLSPEICEELSIKPKKVIAVCEHDTASAVAAVPAAEKDFVYISCGTWSLFGTELDAPCINEMSALINITNETGYGNTTRYLKNIIGLWMIQETRRQFRRDGKEYSYAEMEALAKEAEPFKCFIDPDEPRFSPPGNQVERIRAFCRETGQSVPETDGEIVRCIYESLALKYKYTFENLRRITGRDFAAIHMVGGGTKDGFLCQMTADATNTKVIAGPIEATAIGNIAVQLIAGGEIAGIKEARRIIADSFDVLHYEPKNSGFDEVYQRFTGVLTR